ncbi:RAD55 family ATPase [Krasilnikovia sp. MM14-A1004]|uniref:RAD55 family ATPase n=1 Tax=Krasilnikovia sp. MM14-A1004 TaxID=3373541 RepID=UPI00399CD087
MKRLSTGLADLDLILGGGMERGSTVVFAGPPGSGKTILAQQMCFASGTVEHKAVYYTTLSEPHSKLVEHLCDFAFFDPQALGPEVEYVHLGDMLRGPGAVDLSLLVGEVVRKSVEEEPVLMVIDSTKMLRDFSSDHALRSALYDLTSRVAHSGAVLLLLGEYTTEEMQTRADFTLADAIVHLTYQPREPVDRRTLRVAKMRGAIHLNGAHTAQITSDGFQVYPRVESLLPDDVPPKDGRIPTGIAGLDPLLAGGIPDSDATLVLGPSGVGKTVGCLNFIAEGLARGERCLYMTFQDTVGEVVAMAGRYGWDFSAARGSDQLMVSHVPVGELELDVLAAVVRHRLTDGTTTRVVIDGLAEMAATARETERFPAYLRSILGVVRASSASLWVTSATNTFGAIGEPLAGLMYLFHNVIQLRYIEHCAELGRALNVVKMHSSRHDQAMHTCHITDHGLTIGDPLERVTGMLGGSPLRDCPTTSGANDTGTGN